MPWSPTYRATTTCELVANLLRRSGREQEIDALFLDAGLHDHYVLHRIALEYVRNGYDVRRAARAFLDAGMTTEAAERSGAIERALELRYQWSCEKPSVEAYGVVMTTAKLLGRGEEFDRKMVDAISGDAHGSGIMAEIHIHRRDVDA